MGCQAVPLRAPRGLPVLEGKVWPFPPVSETRPASPRNKLLPKALAKRGAVLGQAVCSAAGETLSPSGSARSRGEWHDTEPTGRRRDPARGPVRIPPPSSEGTAAWQAPPEPACRARRSRMERGQDRERAFLTGMVGTR